MPGLSPSFLGAPLSNPAGGAGDQVPQRQEMDALLALCSKIALPTVSESANGKMGVATLVGGTKVVANTSITANSRIFLMCQTPGGTPGWLQVSARVVATSFTILSSSGTDTSVVAYMIAEPG